MNDNGDITTFMVKFSDNQRSKIEKQNSIGYITKKRSPMEIFTFNFLPVFVTSTILAPLNRIKIILQIQNFLPNTTPQELNGKEIFKSLLKEGGFTSLFKGNTALNMNIFAKMFSKTIFFDRFKYKAQDTLQYMETFKYKLLGLNFMLNFLAALSSSACTLIITYPFDLAYTRIAGQYKMNPSLINQESLNGVKTKDIGNYNAISSCFHKSLVTEVENDFYFRKYYVGVGGAILESLIFSTVTLLGYQILYQFQKENSDKSNKQFISTIIGGTSIISLIASLISYPFDTLKRQLQINGSKGFKNDIYDLDKGIALMKKDLKKFYRGFNLHLARIIPFAPLQYLIFYGMTNAIAKKHTTEVIIKDDTIISNEKI